MKNHASFAIAFGSLLLSLAVLMSCSNAAGSSKTTIAVTGVSLSSTSLSPYVGDTNKLTATVTPSNATNTSVTWTSSDSTVASVDTAGQVKAIKSGTAVITVKTADGGKTAACTVAVIEKTAANDATLSTITVGSTSVAVSSGVYAYPVSVPNDTTSVVITATPTESTATITINGSANPATVAIASGTNTVTIVVTAGDGTTTQTYTLTITCPSAVSAAAVTAGITALGAKDFDTALTKFTVGYAADSSNVDAATWDALLNIAAVSVDANTVSLLQNKAGLSTYPSNMTELFTNTWFNSNWYHAKQVFAAVSNPISYGSYYIRGDVSAGGTGDFMYCDSDGTEHYIVGIFTPNDNGASYSDWYFNGTAYVKVTGSNSASYTHYMYETAIDLSRPVILPRLSVPSWMEPYLGSLNKREYVTTSGETKDSLNIDNYAVVLLGNLIGGNPNGLNDAIDLVLSGPFGTRLTKALALIDALPDTAAINVPASLIKAYERNYAGSDAVINKAELKAFAASVEFTKSFVQLLASYNLNYPITQFQIAFWRTTNDDALIDPTTGLATLESIDNPIKAGFMGNRSDATRAAAKATMLDALAKARESVALFEANWTPSYLGTLAGGNAPSASDLASAKTYLDSAADLAGRFSAAISNGSAIYVDSKYASTGIDQLFPTSSSTGTTWTVYPGTLYSTDIFNPAKLVETTGSSGSPTGIRLYATSASSGTTLSIDTKTGDHTQYLAHAFIKVNYTRVKELFIPSNEYAPAVVASSDGSATEYAYQTVFGTASTSSALTIGAWALYNWLEY
jgi:hypothetical protein